MSTPAWTFASRMRALIVKLKAAGASTLVAEHTRVFLRVFEDQSPEFRRT
jgi:hypothetical protein